MALNLQRVSDDCDVVGPTIEERLVDDIPARREEIIGSGIVGQDLVLRECIEVPHQADNLRAIPRQVDACVHWPASSERHGIPQLLGLIKSGNGLTISTLKPEIATDRARKISPQWRLPDRLPQQLLRGTQR